MKRTFALATCAVLAMGMLGTAQDQAVEVDSPPALTGLKAEAAGHVDELRKLTQEIVDSLFSFSELGFQEFETQRYLTEMLEAEGFTVERGVSGIPSSWWGHLGRGPAGHRPRLGRGRHPAILADAQAWRIASR